MQFKNVTQQQGLSIFELKWIKPTQSVYSVITVFSGFKFVQDYMCKITHCVIRLHMYCISLELYITH